MSWAGCVFRRGGVDAEYDPVELCCILVHTAQGGAETRLATLLAAWLHWFGRLDLHQAIQVRRGLGFLRADFLLNSAPPGRVSMALTCIRPSQVR